MLVQVHICSECTDWCTFLKLLLVKMCWVCGFRILTPLQISLTLPFSGVGARIALEGQIPATRCQIPGTILPDMLHTAIFTVVLIAFWGQWHLGELLGYSELKFDLKCLLSHAALSNPISQNGLYTWTLPPTKTHQQKGKSIIIPAQTATLTLS